MKNPFMMNFNQPQALPGLDMTSKLPNRAAPIGIKGPWQLNPGNAFMPNHRPYMTNIKPAMPAQMPSQKIPKFT